MAQMCCTNRDIGSTRDLYIMTLDSIREFAEYILDDAAFKVSFVQGAQWPHAL